jgi:O-succinylbenzoic acid--CoA ligase
MTIPDWLHHRAGVSPDHPAVLCAGESVSFADLDRRAALAAGRLRRLGVGPGDRIATLAGNRIELAELMHAATRLGAVFVPLGARQSGREIAAQVEDAGARLVCYEAALCDRISALAVPRACLDPEGLPGDPLWSEVEANGLVEGGRIDLDALHSILYTSGSTGEPKGVSLTHGNHFWSAAGSALNLGVHADDRWLACLPLSHVGGLAILLRGVIYGMTVVMHERFDAARVNRAIDEERVTIVSVVANMLRRMLEERAGRPYPSRLRSVLLGGGPAPRALLEECAAAGVPVVQTYGLTEAASQVTTLAPADALRKLGSAGKPLLGTEVRIAQGGVPVPAGATGEIEVRGPTVSPGYDGKPPGVSLRDGWFQTRDLGRFDDEGFLYIVGRIDDMIISGGENVHPAEVEAVLEAHPAVAEACVVGIPDPRWGETVVACVRTKTGHVVTPDEIEAHARVALAAYKVPRRIISVADLPRTASGKLLRRRLREKLAAAPH